MNAPPPAGQQAALSELSKLYLFKGVAPEALAELVHHGRLRTFEPGEVLFDAGAPADHAVLVITGKLNVGLPVGDARRLIGDIRAGEVAGETALLSHNGLRGATLTAELPTVALELTPELMLELADNPAVFALEMHLLGAMSRRIREINLNIKKATRGAAEAGVEPEPAQGSLLGRLRSFFGGTR